MTRFTLPVLTLALMAPLATPAAAQGVFISPPPGFDSEREPLTGQRKFIARDMANLGFGHVDVAALSDRQVAHIANIINGSGATNAKALRINGILSGGSVLENAIDN